MSGQLFSVYWYDNEGNQHRERYLQSLHRCKEAFDRLTMGPAVALGVIKQIKVTDSMDCLVLDLSRHGGRWVDTSTI